MMTLHNSLRLAVAAVALALAAGRATADDDFAYGRRLFLDKAQCAFCHGWAGDGAGALALSP
jgi:mono/diheme cytochrome c family protein